MTARWLLAVVVAITACGPPPPQKPSPLSDAAKLDTRNFWEAFRRGREAEVANRNQDAIEAYRTALALKPDHEDTLYALGGLESACGDYAQGIARLEHLVSVSHDGSPRGEGRLGLIRSGLDPGELADLDGAVAAYSRQLALNPEESGARLRLGWLELLRGNVAAASRHLEPAIGLNHTSAIGHYHLGLARFEAGDRAAALRLFERVAELSAAAKPPKGVLQEGDTNKSRPVLGTAESRRAAVYAAWCRSEVDRDAAPAVELPPAMTPLGVVAADLDRDRRAELLVYDARDIVTLGHQRGRWSVATGKRHALGGAGGASSLAAADFDGDGDVDLAVLRGRSLLLRELQPDGYSAAREIFAAALEGNPTAVSLGDVDGDGDGDVLVGFWRSRARLWRNDGKLGLTELDLPLLGSAPSRAVALADLDHDGRAELLLTAWSPALDDAGGGPPALRLLRTEDGLRFTETSGLAARAAGVMGVATADLDGDGDIEVYVAAGAPAFDGREDDLVLARSADGFGWRPAESEVPANTIAVAAADFDGDGHADVARIVGGQYPVRGRRLVVSLTASKPIYGASLAPVPPLIPDPR